MLKAKYKGVKWILLDRVLLLIFRGRRLRSVSLKLHVSAEGGFKAALQWPIQKGKLAEVRI